MMMMMMMMMETIPKRLPSFPTTARNAVSGRLGSERGAPGRRRPRETRRDGELRIGVAAKGRAESGERNRAGGVADATETPDDERRRGKVKESERRIRTVGNGVEERVFAEIEEQVGERRRRTGGGGEGAVVDAVDWPEDDVSREALLETLGELDMARFTRKFPPVLKTLMRNILDILYQYEIAMDGEEEEDQFGSEAEHGEQSK